MAAVVLMHPYCGAGLLTDTKRPNRTQAVRSLLGGQIVPPGLANLAKQAYNSKPIIGCGGRMKVNMLDAKNQLSRLVKAALAGEDIVIASNGEPMVRLVPVASQSHLKGWGKLKRFR